MTASVYTAITFAPVQGFIEKSRKLRDLYGSSFILSYLSEQVCQAAQRHLRPTEDISKLTWPDDPVVSPALIDVTQGVPNQILIRGDFPRDKAEGAFRKAWRDVVLVCKAWIEAQVPTQADGKSWEYGCWSRFWQAWIEHAWEFFWATGVGETGDNAKEALNVCKFARAWTGVNWTGESSSLSGIDGRAWPHMGKYRPYSRNQADEDAEVRDFYTHLMDKLAEATITPREALSIPELVKRLITIPDVLDDTADSSKPRRLKVETPLSFRDLNRLMNRDLNSREDPVEHASREEDKRWTGWFQGDGDRAGDFLFGKPDDVLHHFSHNMRTWGAGLQRQLPLAYRKNKLDPDGRIIYAGGDDFLGVFYRNPPTDRQTFTVAESPPMTPQECLNWFTTFKSCVWDTEAIWGEFQQWADPADFHGRFVPITVSVGFVWAAPNVPQRDVLQHCREAEQSAKKAGRDRIALRILFNDGKHLEWTCPWWLLEGNAQDKLGSDTVPETGILKAYRDRREQQGDAANWTHLYNDVAMLEARHGFKGGIDVALGLIRIYFGENFAQLLADQGNWWNRYKDSKTKKYPLFTGFLGDQDHFSSKPDAVFEAFNDWVADLAKVGFHLTQGLEPKVLAEVA